MWPLPSGKSPELLGPMPSKMSFGWPNRFIFRQEQLLALHGRKGRLAGAGLGIRIGRNNDSVIVVNSPQPNIEQPMSILATSDTICRIVIARIRELVDVCGIHNCAGRYGGNAVACQCAGGAALRLIDQFTHWAVEYLSTMPVEELNRWSPRFRL